MSSSGLTNGWMASPLSQGDLLPSCLHTRTFAWPSPLLPAPRLPPCGQSASVFASSLRNEGINRFPAAADPFCSSLPPHLCLSYQTLPQNSG